MIFLLKLFLKKPRTKKCQGLDDRGLIEVLGANKSAFEPSKSALSGYKITASSSMFRSNVMVEYIFTKFIA